MRKLLLVCVIAVSCSSKPAIKAGTDTAVAPKSAVELTDRLGDSPETAVPSRPTRRTMGSTS